MNETLSKGEWDVVLGTRLLIKGFAFGPVVSRGPVDG